jgi:hypothetical protein
MIFRGRSRCFVPPLISPVNTYPSTSIRIEDEVQLTTDATFGGHTRAFRPYLNGHNVVATTALGRHAVPRRLPMGSS